MKKTGFSLMEMMIVLLIVAIVAAASAPMISKKMVKSAAGNSSPWVWTSLTSDSIAYNLDGGSGIASIGSAAAPKEANGARLYIDSKDTTTPQIALGVGGANTFKLRTTNDSVFLTNNDPSSANSVAIGKDVKVGSQATALGYKAEANASRSVAIGQQATAPAIASESTAVGSQATSSGANSVAIGVRSQSSGNSSIAIGRIAKAIGSTSIAISPFSEANKDYSTAIGYFSNSYGSAGVAIGRSAKAADYSTSLGYYSESNGTNSVSVGRNSTASNDYSAALGPKSHSYHSYSTAIGYGASTTASRQIVLGDANTTVVIPGSIEFRNDVYVGGSLVVRNGIAANQAAIQKQLMGGRCYDSTNGDSWCYRVKSGTTDGTDMNVVGAYNLWKSKYSDRRLKDVGKPFVGGLDKVKKLEVFNYTFKKDPNKTPHVGVMAQDLQKVFPDAVFKGDDGFLRIRMEDMFYALVNAVKELDAKVTALMDREKKISDLEKQVNSLEKRLEVLEKKVK